MLIKAATACADGAAGEQRFHVSAIALEGAFGLFAAMYGRVSFNRCLVQLEGAMVRCPIANGKTRTLPVAVLGHIGYNAIARGTLM
jgi:hypothetical protein